METRFVTIEEALALHATALQLTHGKLGVHDIGALLGCLERPKTVLGGQEMFPTLFLKAAALTETIARNHPFVDGNKRTAHLLGRELLVLNGYELEPQIEEIEKCMLWIVTQKPPLDEIAAWLEKNSKKQ
ncbi:MAG: death-on-curing family protein [Parcubacteria group bacterium GW2011_GWA1_53_13]|nr:MAG: death-on-curing family protein [Parcubacteria group bacterium GW2011_GWA1_53_13]